MGLIGQKQCSNICIAFLPKIKDVYLAQTKRECLFVFVSVFRKSKLFQLNRFAFETCLYRLKSLSQNLWVFVDRLFGTQFSFLFARNINVLTLFNKLSMYPFFNSVSICLHGFLVGVFNCFWYLLMTSQPCRNACTCDLPSLGVRWNLHLNQHLKEVTICMSNHLTFGIEENNHSAAVNQTLV